MVALLGTVILVAIFGGVAHKPVLIEPGAERPIGELPQKNSLSALNLQPKMS